ncbi:MAG: hypothetical protein HYZ08_00930 [Candidatus Kerfeldbacteria bacterium]|nr:hypothetical protein [Candidatus Kerfeldbacteria bacterium]
MLFLIQIPPNLDKENVMRKRLLVPAAVSILLGAIIAITVYYLGEYVRRTVDQAEDRIMPDAEKDLIPPEPLAGDSLPVFYSGLPQA